MNKIEEYLEKICDAEDKENEKSTDEYNSKPCEFCGHDKLVKKFRNVVGEIKCETTGHFSLFGGSIHGYIDGRTETLPVLACVSCGGERKIETWNYTHESEQFWSDMHYFYFDFYKEDIKPEIEEIYLKNPVDTKRYMLDNEEYNNTFYNVLARLSVKEWKKAGFNFDNVEYVEKTYFSDFDIFKWFPKKKPVIKGW